MSEWPSSHESACCAWRVRLLSMGLVLLDSAWMQTDAELLESWQAGDRLAGKQLFERYFRVINRFFRSKVGDDAQDLVQKTFLGCLESVERYRGDTTFRSWL